MRAIGSFIVWLLALVIVVALVIFAIQNLAPVNTHFLGYAFSPHLWWVIAGSAVLGFILALLLMTPGRVASDWRTRSLARSHAQTEAELADLQDRHMQLQAERDRLAASESGLQAERDQLQVDHDRLLQSQRDQQAQAERDQQLQVESQHQLQAQRDRQAQAERDGDVQSQPQTATPVTSDTGTETRTDTAAPPQRTTVYAHEPGEAETAGPDDTPADTQPTLGDRLRGMFRGPTTDDDANAGTYEQPPAPTA